MRDLVMPRINFRQLLAGEDDFCGENSESNSPHFIVTTWLIQHALDLINEIDFSDSYL
jgi:hypothetical protein